VPLMCATPSPGVSLDNFREGGIGSEGRYRDQSNRNLRSLRPLVCRGRESCVLLSSALAVRK
jgi:hypothetical protein